MPRLNRVGNEPPLLSIRKEYVFAGTVGTGFALGGWVGAVGGGAAYFLGKKVYQSCDCPRAIQNIYSRLFRPIQAASAIQRVTNDLYVSQRVQDTDLAFAMSRLTDENIAVWWELHGRYGSCRGSEVTAKLYNEKRTQKWTDEQNRFFTIGIEGGAIAFRHTLEMFERSRGNPIRPEIWISYVLSGKNRDPSQRVSKEILPHVEMVLTVLTHPDVPFVIHMGIGRTVHNMREVYDKILPQHKGLAIPLHAFTAKAILMTPQGQNKMWMCTRPTWDMAKILDDGLPKGSFLKEENESSLKDEPNMPIFYNEDGSLSIKNATGQIVSTLTKEDLNSGKTAFFHHPEMSQPLPAYAVQYSSLAEAF